MNPLFTLYEVDDKHQAIGWGPMPVHKAIDQAVELVLEGETHLSEDQLRVDFLGQRKLDSFWMTGKGDSTEYMMQLCEWLNGQRGGYRHYFTEEEVVA